MTPTQIRAMGEVRHPQWQWHTTYGSNGIEIVARMNFYAGNVVSPSSSPAEVAIELQKMDMTLHELCQEHLNKSRHIDTSNNSQQKGNN